MPITLDEAKAWLKIELDETYEDALITSMIKSATGWAENYCNIAIVSQSITEVYDLWCRMYLLQRGPVTGIPVVKYRAVSGAAMSTYPSVSYVVDTYSNPERIMITGDAPTVVQEIACVEISYTAGWAVAAVPEVIKTAIKYKVGSMYTHRADMAQRYLNYSSTLLRDYKREYAR